MGCGHEDFPCCGCDRDEILTDEQVRDLLDSEDEMDWEDNQDWEDDMPPEDMDGDHTSALASAGFGTDEDYGCFDGGLE
jgi:hypothetical protein